MVLINFLTNAIKYSSSESTIFIELSKTNNSHIFSLRDTGKGIEAEYLTKIFDQYFQVPGNSKAGTGLGLAISKNFIEAQ